MFVSLMAMQNLYFELNGKFFSDRTPNGAQKILVNMKQICDTPTPLHLY